MPPIPSCTVSPPSQLSRTPRIDITLTDQSQPKPDSATSHQRFTWMILGCTSVRARIMVANLTFSLGLLRLALPIPLRVPLVHRPSPRLSPDSSPFDRLLDQHLSTSNLHPQLVAKSIHTQTQYEFQSIDTLHKTRHELRADQPDIITPIRLTSHLYSPFEDVTKKASTEIDAAKNSIVNCMAGRGYSDGLDLCWIGCGTLLFEWAERFH